jgi:hypothetical protein
LIVFELERYPSRTLDMKGGTIRLVSACDLFTSSTAEIAAAKSQLTASATPQSL